MRSSTTHRDQPFFAYIPFLDVHTPLQAPADLVAKYERKKSSAPPDSWGQERERKVRLVQNHAVYAAMVEQMDRAVGRVLAAIDRAGLAGQTIVIFTSDNGGLSTSEGHPTSNLPLRAGKGWPYEGGIRVPLIIDAPGVTRPGSVCHTPVITTDFYPTLLELTGLAAAPEQHLDGVSLVPLLKGGEIRAAHAVLALPSLRQPRRRPVRVRSRRRLEADRMVRRPCPRALQPARRSGRTTRSSPRTIRTGSTSLAARLNAWRREVSAVMPTPNPNWRGNAARCLLQSEVPYAPLTVNLAFVFTPASSRG